VRIVIKKNDLMVSSDGFKKNLNQEEKKSEFLKLIDEYVEVIRFRYDLPFVAICIYSRSDKTNNVYSQQPLNYKKTASIKKVDISLGSQGEFIEVYLSSNNGNDLSYSLVYEISRSICHKIEHIRLMFAIDDIDNLDDIGIQNGLAKSLRQNFDATGVIIWLKNKNNSIIKSLSVDGFGDMASNEYKISTGVGVVGKAFLGGQYQEIHDFKSSIHKELVRKCGITECVFIKGGLDDMPEYGVSLYFCKQKTFSDFDKRLLDLYIGKLESYLEKTSIVNMHENLLKNVERQAIFTNFGLMQICRIHDLGNCLTDMNSYHEIIEEMAMRGARGDAEKNTLKEYFENAATVTDISRQLRKNANIEKIRKTSYSIVNFLNEMAHIRHDELEISADPIKMNVMLSRYFDDISNVGLMDNQRGSVGTKHKETIRKVDNLQIKANIWMLRVVFFNLIDNAVHWTRTNKKYRKRGEIDLFLEVYDKNCGRIGVADNGPGVDREYDTKLYDLFETQKEDGLGFGLFVCKKFADRHGWKFGHYNNTDGGATFHLDINFV
jgi:signal transduction histidine kinase